MNLDKIIKNKKLFIYTPLIVYWIILFTLTTIPSGNLPKVNTSDKFNHFAGYFILTLLLSISLKVQTKSELLRNYNILFALLIASVYGVVDEIHQMFVPGRFADVLDWVADFLGGLFGILVYILIFRKLFNKIENAQEIQS